MTSTMLPATSTESALLLLVALAAQSRHRVLAAQGPSEDAARKAVVLARRYQASGRPERSLELLRSAAQLWPTASCREESLVEAAATAFSLGRPGEGRRLLDRAGPSVQRHDLRRVATALLATFAGNPGDLGHDSYEPVPAAAQLAAWEQPLVAFSVLVGAGAAGGVAAAARRLSSRRRAESSLAALVALHRRDFSAALRMLRSASDQADSRGLRGVHAHLQTLVGELALDRGDHGEAQRALAIAHELSLSTDQPRWGARVAVAEATMGVLREDVDRDQLVRRAHRLALTGDDSTGHRVELLEASSLAADDRWSDAFDLVRDLAERAPTDVTDLLPAGLLSLLADAAAHCGRRQEARALVSRIAEVDTCCERDVELSELLYATAVLSDSADAETGYEVALALNPRRLPWLHARTSLAYGAWLRRHRRVTESRFHLLAAQRTFDAMDLPTWSRRAQAELRAAGVRGRAAHDAAGAELDLSPQELEIARLVARGLSNRQIAEMLQLSPRTVGSHLYRMFPKLDVTSRSQLAALLDASRGRRRSSA